MSKTNPSFMNGVPELLVLQLLSDTPMYGYEIVKAIREGTGESIALGEGAVYPVLHALEARRELSARKEVVAGRPRIYYRVTAKGKRRLRHVFGEWSRVTRGIVRVFGGDEDALPSPA